MHPAILLVHENDDVRARAVASFSGLPGFAAARPGEAAALASPALRLVILDVSEARNAADHLAEIRGENHLPALALIASFEAEPQALQAGAVALVTHPLAPAEAQALSALASQAGTLSRLSRALSGAAGARPLDVLGDLVATQSGAALAWAQYHAAALLLNEGKLQEALEDLSALVDEQPAFWRAHERLSSVWDVAGDPEAASRHRAISREIRERLARESDAALAAHPEAVEAARSAPSSEPAPEPAAEPVAAEPVAAEPAVSEPAVSDPAVSEPAVLDESMTRDLPEPAAVPVKAKQEPLADVIVADDSELVREMLADVLERAGYAVRLAADGSEAVALAKAKRPDVMILDGLMPGKNGFDACKEVKDHYGAGAPRVLIFSAIYTKLRQRNEAVSLYRADEVLAKPTDKPLDEDELLAAVRRHAGR